MGGGLRTYFLNPPPGILGFLIYPWKFQRKFQGFSPRNSAKLCVLQPWELLRPKAKIPGNSTWFFLDCSWKFYVVFNSPLENPPAIPSIPLEIPYLQSSLFVFFLEKKQAERVNSWIAQSASSFWCLPSMIFFVKNLFDQKQCKYARSIGLAQIRGAPLKFFLLGRNALLYLFVGCCLQFRK